MATLRSSEDKRRNTVSSLEINGARLRRILFFDHTAALSGGEIAMLDLARHLDPSKFKAIVVLGSHGALVDRLRAAGIETHVLPMSPSVVQTRKDSLSPASLLRLLDIARIAGYGFRLARFIRKHEIDLVHANSLKADIVGGIAARLAFRPLIWHVRDRIEDDYLPRFVVRLFRVLCRFIPSQVIGNSLATLRSLRLPAGKKATTIYSGLDLSLYQPNGVSKHEDSGPVIGIVGRISRWKGHHIFLRAAAIVRDRYPDARFQVIGSAMFEEQQYEAELQEQLRQMKLADCVEFTGFREDIPELLAQMDIVAHASISGEPFGQVVVQGMAAGRPIVATQGGGIPEIVEDGQTGFVVPMGDSGRMAEAMCRLLDDPAVAAEMGRRGRERVAELFTIQTSAHRLESVYEELLGRLPDSQVRRAQFAVVGARTEGESG